jgi:DNA (cytosine-5)-methyltransferase 1
MIRVGSLFSGIGGFELGFEAAFGGNMKTVWQVEKDLYCQKILKKHWKNTLLIDDVKKVNKETVEPVDMLIGGFPCQSISISGKMEGLENEEKSGLWWEMFRIISDLEPRPRIIVLENVSNVVRVGGTEVVGSLASIGYDLEWCIVSAREFGAPHIRKRWFCVAYSKRCSTPNKKETATSDRTSKSRTTLESSIQSQRGIRSRKSPVFDHGYTDLSNDPSNSNNKRSQKHTVLTKPPQWKTSKMPEYSSWSNVSGTDRSNTGRSYWKENPNPSPFCTVDDGIPDRLARLKALGNAIVPACSEFVARCILNSGLVDDLLEGEE